MKLKHIGFAVASIVFLPFYFAKAQNNTEGLLGKTNIHQLIESVPTVPQNVATAVSIAFGNNVISPPPERLTAYFKPLHNQTFQIRDELMTYYNSQKKKSEKGETNMEKTVKKQIDQNEIIVNMGGIDALMKMSPEEVERRAKKAVDQFAQNNQKQIANNNKGFSDSEMTNRDQAVATLQLTEKLSVIQLRIQQLNENLTSNIKSLNISKGNFEELNAAFRRAFEQLPDVLLGESRDKDPAKVKALIAADVAKHRLRNEYELKQTALWYNETKTKVKLAVDDYNDVLSIYWQKYKKALKNTPNEANMELTLAQFESDLISEANFLSDISEKAIDRASNIEREQLLRSQL